MNTSSFDDKGARSNCDRVDESVEVKPVDYGNHREAIYRALELNRRFLHDPRPGVKIDETAVRAKIDELLDRLNRQA